jgi:dephospho-CoA kinase
MLGLKKIAITGGVASGKTSVCRYFEELGAFVVNADAIVHDLLTPTTNLGQQIIRQFGPEILENGKISRRILAEKVFNDPEKLKLLEALIHPAVLKKIEELYGQISKEGRYSSFVVEIPLLFEIEGDKFYDVAVAVLSDEAVAKRRFEQAGFQKSDYERRMSRQLKPHQKSIRALYTIHNNGSLEDLRREVIKLNQIIQNKT